MNRFKTAIKTVRISKFIWQRVPNCQASVIKSPIAHSKHRFLMTTNFLRQRSSAYSRRVQLVDAMCYTDKLTVTL